MQGWIKLHRKLSEWEWYTDSQAVHLFVHLVIHANFEDKKWRGILVKRGQFITGRNELSKQTGISEQSIRTNINRLKSTNEITSTSTSKYTIYTIVNYDKFQGLDDKPTSTSTSQLTNDQPATNQQLTTTKNVKNIKTTTHKEEDLQIFDEILKITGGRILDPSPITKWLSAGANKDLILRIVKLKNHDGVKSLKFFDGAIADALQYEKKPLVSAKIQSPKKKAIHELTAQERQDYGY